VNLGPDSDGIHLGGGLRSSNALVTYCGQTRTGAEHSRTSRPEGGASRGVRAPTWSGRAPYGSERFYI